MRSGDRPVAITGIGLACALGTDPATVAADIAAGRNGLRATGDVRDRLPVPGFGLASVDVVPLLKRKKDRKLLPRAAELALVATAAALGDDRPDEVGCVLGVGREPPEEETEPALAAAATDGRLDPERLATIALPLYPPLASLRTLPNLVLAHVAIHLGLTGESGTRAGEEAAGLAAIVEAWRTVAEGRAEVMLAGGADSRVDPGSSRDLVRLGRAGPARGPGEGAAMIRLEPLQRARARGARIWGVIDTAGLAEGTIFDVSRALGSCGAAGGPLALIVALVLGEPFEVGAVEDSGARAFVRWRQGA